MRRGVAQCKGTDVRSSSLRSPCPATYLAQGMSRFIAEKEFAEEARLRSDPDRARSVLIGADDLAAVPGGDGPPSLLVNRVLNEPDRAIQESHIHAAGVV